MCDNKLIDKIMIKDKISIYYYKVKVILET